MQDDDVPKQELLALLGLTSRELVPEMDEPYVYPRRISGTKYEEYLRKALEINDALYPSMGTIGGKS